jgi:predicted ABC-type ATPase
MPRLLVIGGPNGAGKTTAALKLLPEFLRSHEFVNADQIARGLSPLNPESMAIEAGRLMLQRIDELAAEKLNFGFESTLSSRGWVPRLKTLRSSGYEIFVLFVWVRDPQLALTRVRSRALSGGHSIPENVVLRRYSRSIMNFVDLYSVLADHWEIYDNSLARPVLVASGKYEIAGRVLDETIWTKIQAMREQPSEEPLFEKAFRLAVAEAIEEHRRMRRSIFIWRDGKVVEIPPDEIKPLNPDKPMRSSLL